mmetsp:Transcript_33873/g.38504  ORF Transcript_33873/g.38504 Transcript_33873/m.38504 type:complete len:82 (+) Transcript_33873:467-712(+)
MWSFQILVFRLLFPKAHNENMDLHFRQSDQYGTDAKRTKAQTYCEKDTTDEYKMAKAYCKGTRRRCGSPNLDSVRVIQPSQ